MITVKLTTMPDGGSVAYAVAEITAVPSYELLDPDPMQAKQLNQEFFTKYIASLLRGAQLDTMAYEILYLSVPVSDQTYAADVRMYFVIRQYGISPEQNIKAVSQAAEVFCNEMEQHHYSAAFLSEDEEYVAFMNAIRNVNCSSAAAVSRRERTVVNYPMGVIYFTPVLLPNPFANMSELTNALTQYPGSAVSLQIIPTCYQQQEQAALMQCNSILSLQIGEVRRVNGMMPLDASTQAIVDSLGYYSGAVSEPAAICNFIVYSSPLSLSTLCNKVIGVIETGAAGRGSALDITMIPGGRLSLSGYFHIAPWQVSSYLLNDPQLAGVRAAQGVPDGLRRLKYLMGLNEISTVFRFPMDDGTAIGLFSQHVKGNRERLSSGVISDSEDHFKMGTIRSGGAGAALKPAQAGIPLNDFTKHALIVGMPGTGKTNFSLGFLLQMWKEFGIPFLAIEPTKSEYRSLADAIPELQVFTPGRSEVSPFILNPFIPPKNVTVEAYVPTLASAFKAAFSMQDPLPDLFGEAVQECYNQYGWRKSSTRDDPRVQLFGMYEFIRSFKQYVSKLNYKGDVSANMMTAGVVRLLSLIEKNPLIYDNIHTVPLEDMMRYPTVIELNAISNKEEKALVIALLLIMVVSHIKTNISGDGKLKNILLIDEAHVLLGGGGSSAAEGAPQTKSTTIETIEDMIAEVRSYGVSIVIADQSPVKVGRSVVENTFVKVMFRLVETQNKDIIRNATNMSDADYDMLGKLGTGQAMLHSGRLNEPLHIMTYKLEDLAKTLKVPPIRSVISNEEMADMSHYWDTRQEMLVPHAECAYNCACCGRCDPRIRDEADFIASGLRRDKHSEMDEEGKLLHTLSHIDRDIDALVEKNGLQELAGIRFSNCVKIKLLRKVMLAMNYDLPQYKYEQLLKHEKFLKGRPPADPAAENGEVKA